MPRMKKQMPSWLGEATVRPRRQGRRGAAFIGAKLKPLTERADGAGAGFRAGRQESGSLREKSLALQLSRRQFVRRKSPWSARTLAGRACRLVVSGRQVFNTEWRVHGYYCSTERGRIEAAPATERGARGDLRSKRRRQQGLRNIASEAQSKWHERQKNNVCRCSSQNFSNGESPMGED